MKRSSHRSGQMLDVSCKVMWLLIYLDNLHQKVKLQIGLQDKLRFFRSIRKILTKKCVFGKRQNFLSIPPLSYSLFGSDWYDEQQHKQSGGNRKKIIVHLSKAVPVSWYDFSRVDDNEEGAGISKGVSALLEQMLVTTRKIYLHKLTRSNPKSRKHSTCEVKE